MRAQKPSKAFVKHASHRAKAYRTWQSQMETHIQRGLMEGGGTQRCCTLNLPNKSNPVQETCIHSALHSNTINTNVSFSFK